MRKFRYLSAVLACVLVFLAGCGEPAVNVPDTDTTTTDPAAETTEEPAGDETDDRETEAVELQDTIDFLGDMKIGWNLGNTMDASDCTWLSEEMSYETSWQPDVTTPEMMKALKEAGFGTIRVPVSWHNHVSGEDYTISTEWMDRVQEIVDYAIDEGLYVILNIHHDTDKEYIYPDKEHAEQSLHYAACIWKQIAERFADYDNHLIFEGINECRLKGTNNEWNSNENTAAVKEAAQCINDINQTFVDTVRATGGNNATRYLMVSGYCASADGALFNCFKLPKDSVKNRLIVSVHAYTPYDFALNMNGMSEFTDAGKQNIAYFMKKLYNTYVSQGVPVIIGEMGALDKDNLANRVAWAEYYVETAREYGMVCVWWDNNYLGDDGESFGLLNRATCDWVFPELKDALINGTIED